MTDDATGPCLRLPATLDLNAAVPLRSELLGRRGSPLELDGSEVERLGGLCLQVLLSAKAAWALDNLDFRLSRPSAALQEALSILGADAVAGDRQEETSL
jgi:chemotaxis protein CheX